MTSEFLSGATTTLVLAIFAWIVGLPVGASLAALAFGTPRLRWLLQLTSVVFATVPLLAILFWLHYPVQSVLQVVWSPFATSTFLLSMYVAASTGGILLDRLEAVDRKYSDTIRVLGLTQWDHVVHALYPAAWFASIPRLLSLAIATLQATMFCSLIGVEELFRVTLRLNATYLRPVELFLAMGAFYLVLSLPFYLLAKRLSRELSAEPDLA